jgi:hypothetical protein
MSYNLLDVIKDEVKGTAEYVSDEKEAERLSICDACPEKTVLGVCGNCGCVLKFKVKYVQSSCPLEKW